VSEVVGCGQGGGKAVADPSHNPGGGEQGNVQLNGGSWLRGALAGGSQVYESSLRDGKSNA